MTFAMNGYRPAAANRIAMNCLEAACGVVLALATALVAHAEEPDVSVAPQYDTTHVFVSPTDLDAFVESFTAVFGGKPSPTVTATITPTPSAAELRYVWTPVGTLSVFAFTTPVPFPFGTERTGYLVTDIDAALAAARAAGAETIVATFPDPIGRDAVIQWPGGVNMQLYWHLKAPAYDELATIPENRVYVGPEHADQFARAFVAFSKGTVVSDNLQAPGAEIGRPGDTYRRIRLTSRFGKVTVLVTDGHLPYPYGHEVTGYEVANLIEAIAKGQSNGVAVLSGPTTTDGRRFAIVRFPGGYIAEIHDLLIK